MRIGKSIVVGFMLLGLLVSLNACVVVVKGNPNGHTPTQTSASFQYWYYYPNSRVYYHVTEHYYYYPDGKKWHRTRHLPDGWVLNNDYRVRVKLAGKPYRHHALHQRKYPAKHHEARDQHGDKHDHGKNPLRGLDRLKTGKWPGSRKVKQDDDHRPDHAKKDNANVKKHKHDHATANKPTPPGHAKSTTRNKPKKPTHQAGNSASQGKKHLNKGKGNPVASKHSKPQQAKPSHAKAEQSAKPGHPKGNGKSNSSNAKSQGTAKNKNGEKQSMAGKRPNKDHGRSSEMANARANNPPGSHGKKPASPEQAQHSTRVSKVNPAAKDRGERMHSNKASAKPKRQATKPVSKPHHVKATDSPKQNDNVNGKQHGKNPDQKGKGKTKKPEDGDKQQAVSDAKDELSDAEVAANLPKADDQSSRQNKGKGKNR